MAMVAAEAASVAGESAGVGAGEGAAASASGTATRGAGKGGGQLGKAMGAAGAPTQPPGSKSGQGSGRPGRAASSQQPGTSKGKGKSKAAPKLKPLNFRDPRKIILAEFLVCVVIAGLRPFAKDDPKSSTEGTFVQFSAIAALFFTLSLMASGKKSGNVAAAFGGLVTLGVLFRNQKAFAELAKFFKTQATAPPSNENSTTGDSPGNANTTTGDASANDNSNSAVIGG